MKIVVAARCRNGERYVERFLRGYSFADQIVISDGGSTDRSVEMLENRDKVTLLHFDGEETINGHTWNPDAPHMNFVLDAAKALEPDWLIFDDFDCVPNALLRQEARELLSSCEDSQVHIFRLYMWNDNEYFPKMNNYFDPLYTSIWAWQPKKIDIKADITKHHGTLIGVDYPSSAILDTPLCLLHKSWDEDTIEDKLKHYAAVGIDMKHPFIFAGEREPLPEWAKE